MKEGTIIKLTGNILKANTKGRLMRVVDKVEDDLTVGLVAAIPIGDGWDKIDLAVSCYYVPYHMIDRTYKHKEDEP